MQILPHIILTIIKILTPCFDILLQTPLHFILPSSPSAPHLCKLIRKPGCPFLGLWWKVKPNVGNFTSAPSWTKPPNQFPFSTFSSLLEHPGKLLCFPQNHSMNNNGFHTLLLCVCHDLIRSVLTLKPNFQCVGGNLLNLQGDYNNSITG